MRFAAVMIALLLLPAPAGGRAEAHAQLIGAEPKDGALVATAPAMVHLRFNEPVAAVVLRLVEPDGVASELTGHGDGPLLMVPLPALTSPGTRLLSWRVLSGDGHPVGGTLSFSVGARSTPPARSLADSAGSPVALALWSSKWLLYLCLFTGVGGVVFRRLIDPAAAAPGWTLGLARAALVIGAPALAVTLALQGLDILGAAPAQILAPAVLNAAVASPFALTAALSAGGLFAALLASLRLGHRLGLGLAIVAWGLTAAAFAASGHASSAEPRGVMRAAVAVHAAAVTFWVGALPPLAALAAGGSRSLATMLRRFSRLAIPLVALLIGSGLVLAVVQVEAPAALIETAYGRLLSAKLALVAALLLLAAVNRLWLTPAIETGAAAAPGRLSRSIRFEWVLATVILALVAGWRLTPPPRALAAADRAGVSVHLHQVNAMADITLVPGRPGPNRAKVLLLSGDFDALPAKQLTLRFSRPDAGIEPISRAARLQPDGFWTADAPVDLPLSGPWRVTADVLISDFETVPLEGEIELRR